MSNKALWILPLCCVLGLAALQAVSCGSGSDELCDCDPGYPNCTGADGSDIPAGTDTGNPATDDATDQGSETEAVDTSPKDTDTSAPLVTVTVNLPAAFVGPALGVMVGFYEKFPAKGGPDWYVPLTEADLGFKFSTLVAGGTFTLSVNPAKALGMIKPLPIRGTVYAMVGVLVSNPVAPAECEDWSAMSSSSIDLYATTNVTLGALTLAIFDPPNPPGQLDCTEK